MATTREIGRFSKRTLLTGAGWTRNWGGLLAREVWEHLIGQPTISANKRLYQLLLDEASFETALDITRHDPFSAADCESFEQALLHTFVAMDREIARIDHSPSVNISKVQELLFKFWGHCGQDVNSGYLFTLNQDLWPERYLYNNHVYYARPPSLPGLKRRPNQRIFTTDMGPYSDRFNMEVVENPAENTCLVKRFNVIKLHGSFNWRTTDGRGAMVVGGQKSSQIEASPLLNWYFDIFRCVLSAGDVRLMIVGYGFRDEHVNAAISDAIKHHDLKVFVWDVDSDLKSRILAAPYGADIWSGLLSMATRQMSEVFPGNQAKTQEYERICTTFFG